MAKETIVKLYKHFSELAKGNFNEVSLSRELSLKKGEEGGVLVQGKITPARRDLIISDAKRNIEDLERKFPFLKAKDEKKKTEKEVKE